MRVGMLGPLRGAGREIGGARVRALADATGLPFSAGPAARPEELRLTALATRIAADLDAEAGSSTEGASGPGPSLDGVMAELEGLVVALRETRLVTLAGPGGAGKTRLAARCVRALGPDPFQAALGKGAAIPNPERHALGLLPNRR